MINVKIEILRFKALHARVVIFPLIALLLGASHLYADSVVTRERTVTKIAEGIYVIRHPDAPDTFPQGNTTVIIGEREVLVVDSCYLPSSAREDIAQIRQWTNKPVRYLVNTHWHYDHTMGNGVYAEAFPGLAIVAQIETRRQSVGYNPGWFARFPSRAEIFKQRLESGKDANGRALSETEKREFAKAIAGIEPVQAEFKALVDRAPNLTFDSEMNVELGNREVQIKHLGRGNTTGDAILYLPKEKILIAGDLLDHPVPYLGGGYPSELVRTLQQMARFDAQTFVPGHGEVLQGAAGRAYLSEVTEFVQTVTASVSRQVYLIGNGPRNLEAVREAVKKEVDVNSWRQKFAGDDEDNRALFDGFSFPGLLTAAYAEVWGR
ncbi:MAG: MBL fold metallo-hydrolase [Pyrinomonadaceae bacterium]|nr:MBL fold metallo-hydrolase [Pyrinomonadaceae bacterium]